MTTMTHDPVITEAMVEAGAAIVAVETKCASKGEDCEICKTVAGRIYLAMHRANPVVDVEGMGWQPIETVPMSQMVLAWCPKHRLVLLERHGDRQTETWAVSPSGRMDCPEPTHWMPLPAPPAIEAINSQGGV